MAGKRGTITERFWPKVEKGPDCWLWKANKNNKGYGMFYPGHGKVKRLAHRISYQIENGPISDEICVLHRCDNPPCVNPAHLFLGTKMDNAADMDAKGRRRNHLVRTANHKPPPVRRGQDHPGAKLTNADVIAIRQSTIGTAALCRQYGLEKSTVKRIRARRIWTHI